jgi:hypothetical protein
MPSKSRTPVKAIKRPVSASKPVEMKRAKPDKVTDFKPSEIKRKKEEAAKAKAAPKS